MTAVQHAVRPQLKSVRWQREGEQLRVVYDIRDHFLLPDPEGMVAALLELLVEGTRTVPELAAALTARGGLVPEDDVAAAVQVLDAEGLLEDSGGLGVLDAGQRERYFSNLAFFESFASLARSREEFQLVLRESHVLVLGTGGLNSNTIPHLCGLGVGRLTLLDRDEVEPRNFARQYLYRHRDVGARKVALAAEWVRGFDPSVKVEALDAEVDGAERVGELLEEYRPDVVMSGVDSPDEIDDWVNDGCVSRGVPYVRGGTWVTQGLVWSVDPGASGCRACRRSTGGELGGSAGGLAAVRLYGEIPPVNRGIGPAAGLLGALCAFEVLRYLTRFEPPAYAGWPVVVDFASGCATSREDPWPRSLRCPVCRDPVAGQHRSAPAATVQRGGDT